MKIILLVGLLSPILANHIKLRPISDSQCVGPGTALTSVDELVRKALHIDGRHLRRTTGNCDLVDLVSTLIEQRENSIVARHKVCTNVGHTNPSIVIVQCGGETRRISADVDLKLIESADLRGRRDSLQHNGGSLQFDQAAYTVSIREGGLLATRTVITLHALSDSNRVQPTYSMIAPDDARSMRMFSIDRISGEVKTTQVLDRETMEKHVFMVTARQSARVSATARLTINVEDIQVH